MIETKPVAVKELTLVLSNYRTVPQSNETAAVEAMITTMPDRFWALTESLLQDGYLPTESLIVLRGSPKGSLTVKEGNRRVAALKLIHGILPLDGLDVPDNIAAQIGETSRRWRRENREVPCTVYATKDAAIVNRIVKLAHGKGEKAGRDQWNAVARARHNRSHNGTSEPALDLLERFLESARHVSAHQRARWAGAFPLTVLAEAMKRLAPRLGAGSSAALAREYPDIKHRNIFETIVRDIGMENLGFEGIRTKERDFGEAYGLPPLKAKKGEKPGRGQVTAAKKATERESSSTRLVEKALATRDPRAARRLLEQLLSRGRRREKVEALREEAVLLNIRKTPLAFCFVVRSMFELSAKAYCADHASKGGPSPTKPHGQDRPLVDVLRDITKHLTNNSADKEKVKALHGAMTELGKSQGLLSVTSMNQLIHNPRFSVTVSDISVTFANVFPLLEEMNS